MSEEWKDIKLFKGIYQISNLGRVRSLSRVVNNNGGDRFIDGRIIKPFINGSGYLQVRLHKNGKRLLPYVHKLVAEAFIDNLNDFKEVNHIDHDKLNCKVSNLEWCTRQKNMIKMAEFYGIKHIEQHCICGKVLHRNSTICISCLGMLNRKTERPSRDELEILIHTKSFLEIGRMYNVSDNAIRGWCKSYNLPYRKKDLKNLV